MDSLITKAVESLKWYANAKIHHRSLIKYMRVHRAKKYVTRSFEVLKEYGSVRKSLNERHE